MLDADGRNKDGADAVKINRGTVDLNAMSGDSELWFLEGGGDMGALMRAHDWSTSPLGPPERWPPAMRSYVSLMLGSKFPMFAAWGDDLGFIYNDAYVPVLGNKHPRALGRRFHDIWSEIWSDISPLIDATLAGEAVYRDDLPLVMNRKGFDEQTWFTFSYSPMREEGGAIAGMFCACTETTRQVTAERALRQSEERLEMALTAGNSIGTWDWDVASDRVVADARFAQLYGVDPERAKAGAPIAEFFAGIYQDDLKALQEKIAVALRSGEDFAAEYRLRQPDGSFRWVVAQGRCLLGGDGVPLRFPGVSFDITERKAAEARLRELADNISQFAWTADATGSIYWYNKRWYDFTGTTLEEMQGWGWRAVHHPDHVERVVAKVSRYFATGEPWEDTFPLRSATGEYRWFLSRASPIRNEIGEVERWFGTNTDVTDQLTAEEKLRELNATLETRIASAMAEREKTEERLRQSQKMEAVGQLTGGLAHDFNNLLTGIGGSLEMIKSRTAQGRMDVVDRYVAAAQSAVKRAAALTHRLLAFSRRQTLDPKPVNANRLIAGMEELIHRTVGPSVHIEVVGAGGLWSILVDPNQLENALLNLCINARDAMPDGGRLTIETANATLDERVAKERDLKPGQYVSLCVTDTGTGMTPDVVAHAFDPFFTTKPLGAGTGLGLSMIYGFARQSGGQVRITSTVDEGTTMALYLPRHDSETELEAVAAVQTAANAATDGEIVMVIDDEPTIRMLVAEILEEAGYATIEASDGISGMRVLQSSARIDLLITDVGLPGGMNGRQIADAARVFRPGLKVLFITGYADKAFVGSELLETGMQVITKPFEMDVLSRKVRELIEG